MEPIKVRLTRKTKNGTGGAGGGAIRVVSGDAEYAKTAGYALEAKLAERADYAERAGDAVHADEARHAAEADLAEQARDLTADSPVWNKVIRKDKADRTPYALAVGGELTAEGGVRGKDFAAGVHAGFGWRIDKDGNAELESLVLRRWLEVPEVRFNRAKVIEGVEWHAPGGGIIEWISVQPDGVTGEGKLKLEEGEAPAIAVNDLCMGIWHFGDGTDSDKDYDDRQGVMTFSGFTTVYFRIEAVDDSGGFIFRLRDGWKAVPQPGMHFVAFGNTSDTSRQNCRYATRSYTRYMAGVNTWVFNQGMVMAQFGDMTGMRDSSGRDLNGYSAYLTNVYFSGVIEQIENAPLRLTLDTAGDPYAGDGRDCVIQCRVTKGFEDVAAGDVTFAVTCDSGATLSADASGRVTVRLADLRGNPSAMVTVKVTYVRDGRTLEAQGSVVVRDAAELTGPKGDTGAGYSPNLALDTDAARWIPNQNGTATGAWGHYITYRTVLTSVKAGDRFAVSFEDAELEVDGGYSDKRFQVWLYISGSGDLGYTYLSYDNPQGVITVNKDYEGDIIILIHGGINGHLTGNRVRVRRPMLVRGDSPIPWCPAAEEMVGTVGPQGIPGAAGRGVVSNTITYQLGDSGSTAPTGTWSTGVPALVKGKYLWTRSVTTYTSGDPTTLYSVSYIAKDGNNGNDGLPGKNGTSIVSTDVTYARSASGTVAPASGWQTTIPAVPAGEYLWTRTVWTYSDGTYETGYSTARQGADGADGKDGSGYTENLVLDSEAAVEWNHSLYGQKRYYLSEDVGAWEDGTEYTLSFEYEYSDLTTANNGFLGLQIAVRNYGTHFGYVDAYMSLPTNTANQSGKGVFVAKKRIPSGGTPILNRTTIDLFMPNGGTGNCRVWRVKLEKGWNDSPVWTPNTADLKGEKGDKGDPGTPGKNGDKGDKGDPGDPGADARVFEWLPSRGTINAIKGQTSASVIMSAVLRITEGEEVSYPGSMPMGYTGRAVWYNGNSWRGCAGLLPGTDTGQTYTFAPGNVTDLRFQLFRGDCSTDKDSVQPSGCTLVTEKSVPVVLDGESVTGPAGAVLCGPSEWDADTPYYAGGTLVDGIKRHDIVFVTDTYGNADFYIAKQNNTGHAPSGATDAYWTKMNNPGPLYTPAIFAPSARIQFLNGQEIVVSDAHQNIVGRIGCGDIPLYMGGATPDAATYVLDCNGKAYHGSRTGQRVEIDPVTKQINICDAAGTVRTVLSGNTNSIAALTGGEAGTWTRGSKSQNSISGSATSTYTDTAASITVNTAGKTRVSVEISANAAKEVTWTPQGATGLMRIATITAAATAKVVRTDVTPNRVVATETIRTTSGFEASGASRKVDFELALEPGRYELRVEMTLTQGGDWADAPSSVSLPTGSVNWKSVDFESISTPNFKAIYFSNGMFLSGTNKDYVGAVYDSSTGMTFMAENTSGGGIMLDPNGIRTKHHGGKWMPMPEFIFGAYLLFNPSTNAWTVNNVRSFDGSVPTASHTVLGTMRINFPAAWATALGDLLTSNFLPLWNINIMPRFNAAAMAVTGFDSTGMTVTMRNGVAASSESFIIHASIMRY